MSSESRALFFIVNPRAGTGIRVFSAVASRLRALDVPHFAAVTTAAGDATKLAQLACREDFRAIVAVGGDGTINEVVNGLLRADGAVDDRLPIGVIPRGTAQGFARGLNVPLTPAAAVERLLAGREKRIDVGRIRFEDGSMRLFLNVLGVGFDAAVAQRAQEVRPAVASLPAHVLGFASALAAYRNSEISLVLDGEETPSFKARCNLVLAANGPYYATGMRLAPDARMDDGLLDVVIVGDIRKLDLLRNLPRLLAGSPVEHGEVTWRRARRIKLGSVEGALMQADGEVVGHLPAEVDLLPSALRLIS